MQEFISYNSSSTLNYITSSYYLDNILYVKNLSTDNLYVKNLNGIYYTDSTGSIKTLSTDFVQNTKILKSDGVSWFFDDPSFLNTKNTTSGDLTGTFPNPLVKNISNVLSGVLSMSNGGTGVSAISNGLLYVEPPVYTTYFRKSSDGLNYAGFPKTASFSGSNLTDYIPKLSTLSGVNGSYPVMSKTYTDGLSRTYNGINGTCDAYSSYITLKTSDISTNFVSSIYFSQGTWTKPTGHSFLRVICVGGGGGGASGTNYAGSGDGSGVGGYGGSGASMSDAVLNISSLTDGSQISFTVGAGGNGANYPVQTNRVNNIANGSSGGTTSFGTAGTYYYLVAAGGAGGTGTAAGTSTGIGGAGGRGSSLGGVGVIGSCATDFLNTYGTLSTYNVRQGTLGGLGSLGGNSSTAGANLPPTDGGNGGNLPINIGFSVSLYGSGGGSGGPGCTTWGRTGGRGGTGGYGAGGGGGGHSQAMGASMAAEQRTGTRQGGNGGSGYIILISW